jgi:predicted nuclease of predicted toxin-antitoxin system
VVITKDEDFAQLATDNDAGPVVLWVRTGNVLNRALLARFKAAWPEIEAHLGAGARLIEFR